MKKLPNDMLISEINLPGTHDSASLYVAFSHFAKCHNLSIKEQLKIGIRLFDIRINKKRDRIKLVHGIVTCRSNRFGKAIEFSDFCNVITGFLKDNPTEFVAVSIKCEGGENDKETMKYLNERIFSQSDIWYTGNNIPRLGDVRGKAVILNRCDTYEKDSVGLYVYEWPNLNMKTVHDPQFEHLKYSDDNGFIIQDMYQMKPKDKWEKAVRPMLDNIPQSEGLVLNFFSANDSIHSPWQEAKLIYKKFEDYPLEKGKKYGWIMLDYPSIEVINRIKSTWINE